MKLRKKSRLAAKLTNMVLAVALSAFFFVFLIDLGTTYNYYRSQTIANQQIQLEKTASQIRTLQTTVENMGKQILYDEAVLNYVSMEEESTGDYLYARRRVQRSLANYSYIVNGIREIMIYTNDGRTLSSRDIKSPFQPEENEWYQEFLARDMKVGFSSVHEAEPGQNSLTVDVISFIMSYYSVGTTSQELGKLIIDLDVSVIREMMNLSDPLAVSSSLLNWQGDALITIGQNPEETTISDLQTADSSRMRILHPMDDVVITTGDMADNWMLSSVISGKKLLGMAVYTNAWLLLIYGVVLIVLMVLLRWAIRHITVPIQTLSDAAEKVGEGNLDTSVEIKTGDELETLADVFNQMVVNIKELMNESVQHEKQRRHMQIENLMLQINPHFIYNTMNSIVYMARMNGNHQIADFANAFISLLQSTLDVRDSIYSTVGRELKTVENYLYLQTYRYAEKFTYQISCPEELMECRILNVMIQPAVENAIFHGIAPRDAEDGPGTLLIDIFRQDENLIVRIKDDGVGMSSETLDELMKPDHVQKGGVRKIGVANVRDRIRNIYGEPYKLTIESSPGKGTCVTMTVPYSIQ